MDTQFEWMIQKFEVFFETFCREALCDLESASGIGIVCKKQCCQCGDRVHSFFSQLREPSVVYFMVLHGKNALIHVEDM